MQRDERLITHAAALEGAQELTNRPIELLDIVAVRAVGRRADVLVHCKERGVRVGVRQVEEEWLRCVAHKIGRASRVAECHVAELCRLLDDALALVQQARGRVEQGKRRSEPVDVEGHTAA